MTKWCKKTTKIAKEISLYPPVEGSIGSITVREIVQASGQLTFKSLLAAFAGVGVVYWLAAAGALWAGWRDLRELRHQERQGQPKIGQHFQQQVWLATLLWAGLVVGRGMG